MIQPKRVFVRIQIANSGKQSVRVFESLESAMITDMPPSPKWRKTDGRNGHKDGGLYIDFDRPDDFFYLIPSAAGHIVEMDFQYLIGVDAAQQGQDQTKTTIFFEPSPRLVFGSPLKRFNEIDSPRIFQLVGGDDVPAPELGDAVEVIIFTMPYESWVKIKDIYELAGLRLTNVLTDNTVHAQASRAFMNQFDEPAFRALQIKVLGSFYKAESDDKPDESYEPALDVKTNDWLDRLFHHAIVGERLEARKQELEQNGEKLFVSVSMNKWAFGELNLAQLESLGVTDKWVGETYVHFLIPREKFDKLSTDILAGFKLLLNGQVRKPITGGDE